MSLRAGRVALVLGLLGCSEQGAAGPVTRATSLAATLASPLWVRQAELLASDAVDKQGLGVGVALRGDTALVGAMSTELLSKQIGAAYVFERSASGWAQQQKLSASDGSSSDRFGSAVALDDGLALIGASGDYGDGVERGSAYVFVRSGSTWVERQKLTASDAADGDWFGSALAVVGDSALVGAQGRNGRRGAVYVFQRSGNSWSQQVKLSAADGTNNAYFGSAVALSNGTALIGAVGDPSLPGAAYVFTGAGTTWTQRTKLLASDSAVDDGFGQAVAWVDGTALIGAPYCDDQALADAGAAYVFVGSDASFTQQSKLSPTTPKPSARFGVSVSLLGDRALVGASGEESNQGAAYVFERLAGFWQAPSRLAVLAPADGLGISAALSGDTALLGAPWGGDDALSSAGSAYVFEFGTDNGAACSTAGDCASLHCVEGTCCESACSSTCETCLAARKSAGLDGTCGLVVPGTDPRDACPEDDAASCQRNGLCDAAGACALYGAGAVCASAACPTPTSQNLVDRCDGAGTCTVSDTSACERGYRCEAGACHTDCATNQDCHNAGGFVCLAGECKVELGGRCQAGSDCQRGFCTDGVCCETACDGQCEACAEPARLGECVVVMGAPRADRPACSGVGDPECSARCDGEHPNKCQFVAATVLCGSVCSEDTERLSACDGQGRCKAGNSQACLPYVCGRRACLADCTSDAECVSGYACESGDCMPAQGGASCSSTLDASTSRTGETTSCAPFLCNAMTGDCQLVCQSNQQCAADAACNLVSKVCEAGERAASADSGCACRATGSAPSRRLPFELLALLGLRFRRRFGAFRPVWSSPS